MSRYTGKSFVKTNNNNNKTNNKISFHLPALDARGHSENCPALIYKAKDSFPVLLQRNLSARGLSQDSDNLDSQVLQDFSMRGMSISHSMIRGLRKSSLPAWLL